MSRSSGLPAVAAATATAAVLGADAYLRRANAARSAGRPTRWTRANYRGRPVSLAGGLAAVAGVGSGLGAAVAVRPQQPADRGLGGAVAAVAAAAAAGWYDDARSALSREQRTKGLRGHVRAFASGRVSAGAVKLAVTVAGGAAAAALARRGGALPDVAVDTVAVAGTAHLVNLLDLRPGRALKGSLALAAGAFAVCPPGSARALSSVVAVTALIGLPSDLAGRTMLGDLGAGTLGAAVGAAAVSGAPPLARRLLAAATVALAVTAERVSFSAVIDATPALRAVDRLGRPADDNGEPAGTPERGGGGLRTPDRGGRPA